jgi:uncharacterized protein YdhG (YjbR/CyaY superfamily)
MGAFKYSTHGLTVPPLERSLKNMASKAARTPSKKSNGPKTIDEYLAMVPPEKRAALEKLRAVITGCAPKAEECISYQIPAFRQNGILVGFSASANHCSFFPMNGSTVEAHKDELKDFETSKGTIRFLPEKPLPVALVRKIVKERLAQNTA